MSVVVGDYASFLHYWHQPHGGIQGYLSRFLASGDPTFQHIAIWTLLQLLESEDQKLIERINESKDIVDMVRAISEKEGLSGDEREGSFEGEGEDDDGEGEVVGLAKRCCEFLGDGGGSAEGGSSKGLTEG
jgi:vacuolar protein 8